jgi:hypothetical protein
MVTLHRSSDCLWRNYMHFTYELNDSKRLKPNWVAWLCLIIGSQFTLDTSSSIDHINRYAIYKSLFDSHHLCNQCNLPKKAPWVFTIGTCAIKEDKIGMCSKFGIWHTNLIWHHVPQPIASQNKKLQFIIYLLFLTEYFAKAWVNCSVLR